MFSKKSSSPKNGYYFLIQKANDEKKQKQEIVDAQQKIDQLKNEKKLLDESFNEIKSKYNSLLIERGASLKEIFVNYNDSFQITDTKIKFFLDNNVHDSTGQQLTNATNVEFANVAINCGYKQSYSTDNTNDFSKILKKNLVNTNGPIFIHIKIKKGSFDNLGRPTIQPKDVAKRFKNFLKN